MPFCVGQMLRQRYQILGELSQIREHVHGNFGTIYLALDAVENRVVVIKESKTTEPAVQNTLLEEIKLLTAIQHAHLPRLFDYFHSDEQRLCMVMEYIPGKSLQSVYSPGQPLDIATAVSWMRQVLGALAQLHSHSPPVVHCDVKLANIQIHAATSQAYLLDFGIATADHAPSSQIGTPPFAAPEQYEPRPLTPAVDTYAVGVCLYMLLTGQPPHQYVPHSEQERVSPRALNPTIPPALERVIMRALAMAPRQRYPNAQSMLEALRVVPLPSRASGPPRPRAATWKRPRRLQPHRRSARPGDSRPARPRPASHHRVASAGGGPPARPMHEDKRLAPSQSTSPMLIVWDSRQFWAVGSILLSLISYSLLVLPSDLIAPTIKYGMIVCGSYPIVVIGLVALSHIRQKGLFFEKMHVIWVAIFMLYSITVDRLSMMFSDPKAIQSLHHLISQFSLSMLLMIAQGAIAGALVMCCQRSLPRESRLEME